MPGCKARERAGRMDMDLVREMGSLELVAPELRKDFGGLGAGTLCAGAIIEKIGRAEFTFGYVPLMIFLNGQILACSARLEIARDWLTRVRRARPSWPWPWPWPWP